MRSMELIWGYILPNLNTDRKQYKKRERLLRNIIGKEYSTGQKNILRMQYALQSLNYLNDYNTFFYNSPKDIDRLDLILNMIPATDVYEYDAHYLSGLPTIIITKAKTILEYFLCSCHESMITINNHNKLPIFYDFIMLLITLNCKQTSCTKKRKVSFNNCVWVYRFYNDKPMNIIQSSIKLLNHKNEISFEKYLKQNNEFN